MNNLFNILSVNFTSFYSQLNEVGKLVFLVAVLLFFILIILIIIMMLQKTIADRQLKLIYEDEKDLDDFKNIENLDIRKIDINNEKTVDLRNIVDELKKHPQAENISDIYEDEQEKTAIISYQELLKAASGVVSNEPIVKKIEPNVEVKPKREEIFSSVFTPDQQPVYKEKVKEEVKTNDSDVFLNSLKNFRSNL